MRFVIPDKKWTTLRNEIKRAEYRKGIIREIKKTKIAVSPFISWGTARKRSKKEPSKKLISFRLRAKNAVDYKEFFKVLPPIQRRIEKIKRHGIKEFEAMACTEFGFSLEEFKPVGQLPIPAELPLTSELKERVGEPTLSAFGIVFKNSPLGLEQALIDFEEEENNLSVTVGSWFLSESVDKLVAGAYEHVAEIAKLFVVKKE